MKELTVSCGNSVLQIRHSMDHATEICMGIPGRRLDIRMAQQLLNNPNIGTCFPGQGGEGVAAAVGGQVTHRGHRFPQLAKECIIVPGKIPGMKNRAVLCTEQKFSRMGQTLEPIGQLRQKGDGAQAVLCLGFMLRDAWVIVYQVHGTVDGQGPPVSACQKSLPLSKNSRALQFIALILPQ